MYVLPGIYMFHSNSVKVFVEKNYMKYIHTPCMEIECFKEPRTGSRKIRNFFIYFGNTHIPTHWNHINEILEGNSEKAGYNSMIQLEDDSEN